MTVIDVHCHIAPESCLPMEAVGPDGRTYGLSVGRDACGATCPVVDGRPNANCEPEQLHDVGRRLRDMDAAGVDVQVLSPVTYFYFYNLPAGECAARARRINAAVAEIAHGRPDRFRGMATVPLQDPDLAAAELEHAVRELGLHGVEICSNVDGRNLDEPAFRPFFEAADRLGVPVFVHPSSVAAADRLGSHYLANLIGNPLDSAICIASLMFGGVLDAFPGLKLVFAHGGGVAPILAGRWTHGREVRPECRELPRTPREYLASLHYDTITHDAGALRYLRDLVGPSRILLGTDYPFDMGDADPLGTISALSGLDDDDRAGMRGATAARLYGVAA